MKYIQLLVIVFCFCVVGHSQIIKTEAGRRLTVVETKIAILQAEIDQKTQRRQELLVMFTTEHLSVKKVDAELAELNDTLRKLESEKKELKDKGQLIKLPNTNVELLKVIALQNEQIIELLQQLARQSHK